MNFKNSLFALCLGLLFIVVGHREAAQAGPFDEAFGIVSALSRSYQHYRPYSRSRRSYRRRARRARRARAARYRYAKRRRIYAQRRAAVRARRYRKRRMARVRRNNARRQARSRQVKKIRRRNKAIKIARRNKLRLRQQARGRRSRKSRRIQQTGQSRNIELATANRASAISARKKLAQKTAKILPKRRLRKELLGAKSRPAESKQIIEQARNKLAYGRQEEGVYLGYTEKVNVQRALASAGFYHGRADGQFGRYTRKAIHAYQRSINQARTGRLSRRQLASLLAAGTKVTVQDADYLPQGDQEKKRRDAVRAKAKALNEKLKLAALKQLQRSHVVPQIKPNVMPKPVPKVVIPNRGVVIPKAKPSWPKIVPKKVVPKQVAAKAFVKLARNNAKAALETGRKSIFSKAQSKQKQQARLITKVDIAKKPKVMPKPKPKPKPKAIKQAKEMKVASLKKKTIQPVPKAQKQAAKQNKEAVSRKVDYFHILGRTAAGENLWVVKCFDKNQLKVYFWRDQKWWVRGANAGPMGYSEYGQKGIQKLARRVCEI